MGCYQKDFGFLSHKKGRFFQLGMLICFAWGLLFASVMGVPAYEIVDIVSGVIDAPQFKGRDPLSSLRLASDLLHEKKLKNTDLSFALLDWGDQYLREPSDPLDRLRRWTEFVSDDKLGQLKIPRDFLNRILLAEYLVNKTPYLKSSPIKRLELISKLEQKRLVEASVALSYARLYGGAVIFGSRSDSFVGPLDALNMLKKMEDGKLIGWHYRMPVESVLAAEALALDNEYQSASPLERLERIRDWEKKGLITAQSKRELEKLPAWRLLVSDPGFLKADAKTKRDRLAKLEAEGLISSSTLTELKTIFRPTSMAPSIRTRPSPLPKQNAPLGK
jgi:hypothetical protein